MPLYRIPFKKTVVGYLDVVAKTIEDAQERKFQEELEEYEADVEYEFDDHNIEEVAKEPLDEVIDDY